MAEFALVDEGSLTAIRTVTAEVPFSLEDLIAAKRQYENDLASIERDQVDLDMRRAALAQRLADIEEMREGLAGLVALDLSTSRPGRTSRALSW